MADTSNVNLQNVTNEPANARKKRTKSVTATSSAPTTADTLTPSKSEDYKANGIDGTYESPYIREVQKNIRNVSKKLNSMQKVDAIISENKDQSLDELVTARKINADQKAQALKKPALQAQLSQLEDQITHYRKLDQDYQKRMAKERQELETEHAEEIRRLKETYEAEAHQETPNLLKHHLLILSRFLRAAAARRQREDDDSEESKAFEGALLLVYGGDHSAVAAAEKLIEQSEDNIPSTEGVTLQVTYAQVMQAALAETLLPEETGEDVDTTANAEKNTTIDPTVANAGLTEIESKSLQPNGTVMESTTSTAPGKASIDSSAANATAKEQWDSKITTTEGLGESFEMIPRNASEIETKPITTSTSSSGPMLVQRSNTQSWADDHPAGPPLAREGIKAIPNGNDGFREVHHGRGGRSRGGYHGDYRGGFRGKHRGDGLGYRNRGYRGRGGGYRGGFRGRDNANT